MFQRAHGVIIAITFSLTATFAPSNVSADDIALTFEDHGMTIAGEYIGFQENAYVIKTTAGTLHVPAALVSCQGNDCLDIIDAAPQDNDNL